MGICNFYYHLTKNGLTPVGQLAYDGQDQLVDSLCNEQPILIEAALYGYAFSGQKAHVIDLLKTNPELSGLAIAGYARGQHLNDLYDLLADHADEQNYAIYGLAQANDNANVSALVIKHPKILQDAIRGFASVGNETALNDYLPGTPFTQMALVSAAKNGQFRLVDGYIKRFNLYQPHEDRDLEHALVKNNLMLAYIEGGHFYPVAELLRNGANHTIAIQAFMSPDTGRIQLDDFFDFLAHIEDKELNHQLKNQLIQAFCHTKPEIEETKKYAGKTVKLISDHHDPEISEIVDWLLDDHSTTCTPSF